MTQLRTPSRELPVLDIVPPPVTAPRVGAPPRDERLTEYLPEPASLPRFSIWTLGCQMNRSDSEEMAGRLLAAGCTEASSFEAADLVVINSCAIREAAEQKVIGRQGQLNRLKAANPSLRVVLTGCAVRERDRAGLVKRFPAVDLFLRPDEEPELVDRLGLASAQGAIGHVGTAVGAVARSVSAVGAVDRSVGRVGAVARSVGRVGAVDGSVGRVGAVDGSVGRVGAVDGSVGRVGATTIVGTTVVGAADNLSATRAHAIAGGAIARDSSISAWLPIVYGCDKTCTYCIVPFSRGPERSRPFDDILAEARSLAAAGYREVTLLGQNVNSYGHDLPAEDRFGHIATERTTGRRLDTHGRPDLAELLRAIDALRTADGQAAIPRIRFVTSHPWDLSDRLVWAMGECAGVCEHLHLPVQSGDDAVLRRMGRQYTIEHYLERLETIRRAIPGIAVSTDVIVGFCGETERQFEATLNLLRAVRYDQVFAAAFSPRPGTPAARLADDVPADVKRRRLNELLAIQEEIGLDRNRAWLGREVEVLADTIVPPRGHEHGEDHQPGGDPAVGAAVDDGMVRLSGRSRENKLVHLSGDPALVGRIVRVRVDHAGPYALRGALAT